MRIGFKSWAVAGAMVALMIAPRANAAMSWELLMQVGSDFIDVTSNGTTTSCTSSAGIASTSCGNGTSSFLGAGHGGSQGQLFYSGGIDSYTVNIQSAVSLPLLSLPKIMDLGSQLSGSGAQAITVKFAVTGLT